MTEQEIKIGRVVKVFGHVEEVVQKKDGLYYWVRFHDGINGTVLLPAYKVVSLPLED